MQAEIADEDCDENGDEAPQQVQILEHHRVAQTADHADTGFLCQRANNQRLITVRVVLSSSGLCGL